MRFLDRAGPAAHAVNLRVIVETDDATVVGDVDLSDEGDVVEDAEVTHDAD